MYEIDSDSEEFSRGLLEIYNDPETANEWLPSFKFEEYAGRDLALEVSDREKSKEPHPDYYYVINGQKIGMEITSLLEDNLMQRNAFFQRVEGIIKELVEDQKSELPPGNYHINFFPGEMQDVAPEVRMQMPVWGRSFKRNEYEPQIGSCVASLIHDFQGKQVTAEVRNNQGELIGTINLSRLSDNDTVNVFIWPQGVFRLGEWSKEELQQTLQERVAVKDGKYCKLELGTPCWLLISDARGMMSTGTIEFDINSITLTSSCFERVFLMSGIETNYMISELPIKKS